MPSFCATLTLLAIWDIATIFSHLLTLWEYHGCISGRMNAHEVLHFAASASQTKSISVERFNIPLAIVPHHVSLIDFIGGVC